MQNRCSHKPHRLNAKQKIYFTYQYQILFLYNFMKDNINKDLNYTNSINILYRILIRIQILL